MPSGVAGKTERWMACRTGFQKPETRVGRVNGTDDGTAGRTGAVVPLRFLACRARRPPKKKTRPFPAGAAVSVFQMNSLAHRGKDEQVSSGCVSSLG